MPPKQTKRSPRVIEELSDSQTVIGDFYKARPGAFARQFAGSFALDKLKIDAAVRFRDQRNEHGRVLVDQAAQDILDSIDAVQEKVEATAAEDQKEWTNVIMERLRELLKCAENQESAALRGQINALRGQVNALNHFNDYLSTELGKKDKAIREVNKKNEELQAALNSKVGEAENLKKQCEEQKIEQDKAAKQSSELKSKHQRLEDRSVAAAKFLERQVEDLAGEMAKNGVRCAKIR